MSDAVEIYLCKAGQKLEEGKVVYAHDIYGKEDAQEDAERRGRIDKSLAKIAYYQVSATGSFKCMYTWNRPQEKDAGPKKKAKRKAPPKKKTLIEKVMGAFGGGGKKAPAKGKKKGVKKR